MTAWPQHLRGAHQDGKRHMPASKFVAAVFLAVVFVGAPSSFGAAALTYRVAAGRTTSGPVGFSAKTATGTHDAPSMSFTDARTRTRVGCTVGRVHGSVTLGR